MALGPELILNGNFELGDNGDWVKVGAITITDNAYIDGTAGASNIRQDVLQEGVVYEFDFDISDLVTGGGSHANQVANSGILTLYQIVSNGHHNFQATWVAGGIPSRVVFYSYDGGAMRIDNISIKEVLPDTTTVDIEWIDSISAAATGNKIYRDDVEIADIANGIQIYSDATAETGTEYKYEVQAYSATDETTQEVLGVNVQYITTA